MKSSIVHKAIGTILAIYILCVSGGVNVYHYCCNACESYGHNIYQTISCDEVHSQHHCTDTNCTHLHTLSHIHNIDDLCAHIAQNSSHCDVHHIDAPQLTIDSDNIAVPTTAITAILVNTETILVDHDIATATIESSLPNAPPILDGRAIIALKSSLLI